MADIPIVDFAKAIDGTPEERQHVARQIDEAFRGAGFVYLRNHGVPLDLVAECFAWVRQRDDPRMFTKNKLTYI
jgi:isopenicillin N synthase-like dioxygenase